MNRNYLQKKITVGDSRLTEVLVAAQGVAQQNIPKTSSEISAFNEHIFFQNLLQKHFWNIERHGQLTTSENLKNEREGQKMSLALNFICRRY